MPNDAAPPPRDTAESLEALDLSEDIASREGVDISHTSRMRLDFLLGQNHSFVRQTQFADTKAGLLMTLMGLLALEGPAPVSALGAGDYDAMVVLALNVASLALCVVTVLPRYPPDATRRAMIASDRFSWPSLTAPGEHAESFPDFMRTAQASQLVVSVARSNRAVAAIIIRKYRLLRIALFLAIADFALLALYLAGVRPLAQLA